MINIKRIKTGWTAIQSARKESDFKYFNGNNEWVEYQTVWHELEKLVRELERTKNDKVILWLS